MRSGLWCYIDKLNEGIESTLIETNLLPSPLCCRLDSCCLDSCCLDSRSKLVMRHMWYINRVACARTHTQGAELNTSAC